MLAYVLSLVVGLSSIALYMAAFFFPEVHRKNDFLWSGLGMFYALVLWVCAGRITGGVLLGQMTSVILLGWLGWQTLALRRQVAPVEHQTVVPTAAEWQTLISNAWGSLAKVELLAPLAKPIGQQVTKLTAWVEALVTTTTHSTGSPPPSPPSTVESPPYAPLTPADFANASQATTRPPKTIVTDAAPVLSGSKTQPGESPLTAIAKQVQGAFKGLTAKPESKPVYVRKQFRKPDDEPKPTVDVGAVAVAGDRTEPMPSVSEVASDGVEAAIVETEPTVTPSPSTTVDAEAVLPTEPTP